MPGTERKEIAVRQLDIDESFVYPEYSTNIRINVEWSSKVAGIICDLDTNVLFFDERARFVEKLDATSRKSKDGSSVLLADFDHAQSGTSFSESVKIDLNKVSKNISAILFLLDGGPRNFQFVQSVAVQCIQIPVDNSTNILAPIGGDTHSYPLFNITGKTRKDYQGVALFVIYKDGWHENGIKDEMTDLKRSPSRSKFNQKWVAKSFLEPIYVTTKKAIDERCGQLVVGAVPALEKFRPRLFNSVRDICAALSSTALPKLKKKFLRSETGLEIVPFTEVLFKQLHESFPRIAEDDEEAAFTVAMIQEMFYQIDYNGDNSTDWDEFTTFCIQNGMVFGGSSGGDGKASESDNLDEYIIEYGEDILMRDRYLSPHRYVSLMKYIPDIRRILIVTEGSDSILIFDESFRLKSQLYPSKVQILGSISDSSNDPVKVSSQGNNGPKSFIYDVVYLTGRDMYAFTSSDHTIMICKDQTTMGGKKTTFFQHNKVYHSLLHLKLCWSEKHSILCSVASDKVIYGWDIDKIQPIFQIARHSDLITDFIAADNLDCFISCSMDRRIVMWSATSRRVKGILLGHKRGVRCMSLFETTLLSAGFECDAMTWDLIAKDPVAILRGHRRPITAVKLMCEHANAEKDFRAVTVDEGGELRLWNIYVKERTSDATVLPSIQVFEMLHPESPMNEIKFLALPYNSKLSTSYYSDIVVCSTKLMHFLPEKNAKEFVPPSCCVFNESAASIMTSCGHSIIKYDVCTGQFISTFPDVCGVDLSAMCMDGVRGRRVYVGCSNGDLLIVNVNNGAIIDKLSVHTKEITGIAVHIGSRNNIYTCSTDGRLKLIEEMGGKLHSQNTVENVFGEGVGVGSIRMAASLKAIVVASTSMYWGIWNKSTLKKILSIQEHTAVCAIEVLGTSVEGMDHVGKETPSSHKDKESLLTVVVALVDCAKVYTVDTYDVRGINSFIVSYDQPIYVTDSVLMHLPTDDSVNYSKVKSSLSEADLGAQLAVSTDDGLILTWNMNRVQTESERMFRDTYHGVPVDRNHVVTNTTDEEFHLEKFLDFPLIGESRGKKRAPLLTNNGISRSKSSSTISPTNCDSRDTNSPFLTDVQTVENHVPTTSSRDGPKLKNEFKSTFLCPPKSNRIQIIRPNRCWLAHIDFVGGLVSFEEHGCIFSYSHDGFHRMWNADCECLGELSLPNLTERMKNPRQKVADIGGWKFILERIPASQAHRDLAGRLIESINSQKRHLSDNRAERRNAAKSSMKDIKAFQESLSIAARSIEIEQDDHSKFRQSLLESLNEPSVIPDDAPPSHILSKEEKRIADLAQALEKASLVASASATQGNNLNEKSIQSSASFPNLIAGTKSTLTLDGSTSTMKQQPSLWSLADDMQTSDNSAKVFSVPPAFSEASLSSAMRQGVIDGEGFRILRRIGSKPDKVAAYDRLQAQVLLRNPSMSVSFEMPSSENIRRSEVEFGDQKDMYKNAEVVLREKNNLSVAAMRNSIALNRIEQRARRVKTMVHILSPNSRSQEHVVLHESQGDHESENDRLRSDEQKMRLRLLQSAALVPLDAQAKARPLDREFIDAQIQKVKVATDLGPEWEARFKEITSRPGMKRKKKKATISQATKDILEKKLAAAIKDDYKAKSTNMVAQKTESFGKKTLTTRALLPFYKLEDVRKFMDIFAKVDEDFSGDLDINEWVKLFSSLNQNISAQEARMIFMKVDTNGDGFLSMAELAPVVFNKATKEQLKAIIAYAESEIVRKHTGMATVTISELEQLFESYDADNIGFVVVSLIRERIRAMQLPEQVQFFFMDSILDIADDEMVNFVEFSRMFKSLIAKEEARK